MRIQDPKWAKKSCSLNQRSKKQTDMEYDDTKVTLFLMNVKINIVCMMCIFFLLSYVLFVNERKKWHFFQVSHIGSVIYYKFILCILKTELFCDLHILFLYNLCKLIREIFLKILFG